MKTLLYSNGDPIELCPRPVCEAVRGSHDEKVTVMFGSDPVQSDTLSNPCELQNN